MKKEKKIWCVCACMAEAVVTPGILARIVKGEMFYRYSCMHM